MVAVMETVLMSGRVLGAPRSVASPLLPWAPQPSGKVGLFGGCTQYTRPGTELIVSLYVLNGAALVWKGSSAGLPTSHSRCS